MKNLNFEIFIIKLIFILKNFTYCFAQVNQISPKLYWNESLVHPIGLINHYGFKGEEHPYTTEDGYFLTLHRIANESGIPVILAHGLGGSSKHWLLPITGNSENCLAFELSRSGFDVWLYNSRGNNYSRGHKDKTKIIQSKEYWNFSMDELSHYDLPATIDYVIEKTGENVIWLGMSLGGILPLNLLSRRSEYNDKLRLFISFAAGTTFSKVPPLYKLIAQILFHPEEPGKFLLRLFAQNDHLVTEEFWNSIIPNFLGFYNVVCTLLKPICDVIIHIFLGFSQNTLNLHEFARMYLTSEQLNLSVKSLVHLAQRVLSNIPRFYDYGRWNNMRIYGSPNAPVYNLSKITVPTAFYNGASDLFFPIESAIEAARDMSNVVKIEKVDNNGWNHLDFVASQNAPDVLYKPVIKFIKEFLAK